MVNSSFAIIYFVLGIAYLVLLVKSYKKNKKDKVELVLNVMLTICFMLLALINLLKV